MKVRHAHRIRIGILSARDPWAPRDLEWLNPLTLRAFTRESKRVWELAIWDREEARAGGSHGGIPAIIGEGRYDEAVVPLDETIQRFLRGNDGGDVA